MLILASGLTLLLSIAIVAVSVLLIGLVLLQKNRGSGLSGAFGGVGGHSAFGTKTGDFLTWLTVGLTTLFLLLNVVGNYAFEPDDVAARGRPADQAESTDIPEEQLPGEEAPPPEPVPAPAAGQGQTPAGNAGTPPTEQPTNPPPTPAESTPTSPSGTGSTQPAP